MQVLAVLLLLVTQAPHQFSVRDYWQARCDAGDPQYCQRLQDSAGEAGEAEMLDRLASEFAAAVDRPALQQDRRPRYLQAYPRIMEDFFERASGRTLPDHEYDAERVGYCARHFHDYWLQRKMWWPTDDAGQPDWKSIYLYVVDHYLGLCIREGFQPPR